MDRNICTVTCLLISTSWKRQPLPPPPTPCPAQFSSQSLNRSSGYPCLVACKLWGREVAPKLTNLPESCDRQEGDFQKGEMWGRQKTNTIFFLS